MRKTIITLLVVAFTAPAAFCQTYPTTAYKLPTTGHAVRNTVSWTGNKPRIPAPVNTQFTNRYQRPINNVRAYTINRYFAGNPRLSPYLHLTRPRPATGLNNYYRHVVPEISNRPQLPSFQDYTTPWNH